MHVKSFEKFRDFSKTAIFCIKYDFRQIMDLEFYRNDDMTAEMVKDKCLEALNDINWKGQVSFNRQTTIETAIELAQQGLDGGLEGTYQLQPDDLDFHRWMQFAFLCTILYNRDRDTRKYTILRKCYFKLALNVKYYTTENTTRETYGRILPAFRYNSVIMFYIN